MRTIRTLRPRWVLAASALLLAAAWREVNRDEPESGSATPHREHSVSAREKIVAPRVEADSRERVPPAAQPEDRAERWLRVSAVHRKSLMSHEAMEPYEVILAAFHLSDERLLRLQELIVEREESAQDAESLARDERLTPEGTALLREEAKGFFDRDLAEVVGPANIADLRRMLALRPQLEQIVQTAGPALGQGGEIALDADQLLRLAQVYQETFAPVRSGAPVDRVAGFDSRTGLAAADREALARASAILSRDQLAALEKALARMTTAYATAGR